MNEAVVCNMVRCGRSNSVTVRERVHVNSFEHMIRQSRTESLRVQRTTEVFNSESRSIARGGVRQLTLNHVPRPNSYSTANRQERGRKRQTLIPLRC